MLLLFFTVHLETYSIGLQTKYAQNEEFAHQLKKLIALAFVPVNNIILTYEKLIDTNFYTHNELILQPLLDYYEETWIGKRNRRGKRQNAHFPIALWNSYNRTQENLPRTNNAIEGWHHEFAVRLQAHHVTIWKFIEGLQMEQSD